MSKYCCDMMDQAILLECKSHDSEFECPDVLISYSEKFDEYGIIYHDGGSSVSSIKFCPYCGIKLPESKRDLWFESLEKLGFNEPFVQDIPEEYKSGKWHQA